MLSFENPVVWGFALGLGAMFAVICLLLNHLVEEEEKTNKLIEQLLKEVKSLKK